MTREEKEELLSKIWDLPKPKDDSNYWQGVDDVADLISNMPITEGEKGTDTERIKQNLSELAQYNADMLKAFNAGKELAERELAEREKGEWIRNGSYTVAPVYRCSNCNQRVTIIWGEKYKCCPNCEADMRGDKEGE